MKHLRKYHKEEQFSLRKSTILDEETGKYHFRSVHFKIKCNEINDKMIIDIKNGLIRQKRSAMEPSGLGIVIQKKS